ncbi:MAG: hypothetical protein ACREA9_25010 [Pyrinomonadaceae bacterium]
MPNNDATSDRQDIKPEQEKTLPFGLGLGLWIVGAIGIVLVVGVGFIAYYKVNEHSVRISFMVSSTLNLLIFLGVLVQAHIYRRMAAQNERLIRASEDNAKTAREAFHVGEAPYFGIAKIAPEGFENAYAPSVRITFVNGGKTPAWHFHSKARAIVGQTPENGQSYGLETKWHDLPNTFFRTNDYHTFEYQHHLFRYSPELEKRIIDREMHIFFVIKIHYSDFRKRWRHRDFRLIWDADGRNFRDYDAEERNCDECRKKRKEPS